MNEQQSDQVAQRDVPGKVTTGEIGPIRKPVPQDTEESEKQKRDVAALFCCQR